MSVHGRAATIENGFVQLPNEAHWLVDTLAELAAEAPALIASSCRAWAAWSLLAVTAPVDRDPL